MGKLFVNDKDLVVPGEIIAEGMDYLPAGGVLREDEKLVATVVGLVSIDGRIIKLIPLVGRYVPKKDDVVIGKVVDITYFGWRIDIGWAYEANLPIKEAVSEFVERGTDLTQYYNFGDFIMAKILNVSGAKLIDLTMKGPGLKKLTEGRLIKITPTKVPRVIGKQGSMVNLIKEKTSCKILVGQNGIVWIAGPTAEKEKLAVDAIRIVEAEAQTEGLTEKVAAFLDEELKKFEEKSKTQNQEK